MNRFALVVSGLVGTLLLGPAVRQAGADGLTGTWEATAAVKCEGLVGAQKPGKTASNIAIKISSATPTGLNVCTDLQRTDLNSFLNGPAPHLYHSTLFTKSGKSSSSYGTLTQSGTAINAGDLSGAVGTFKEGVNKKATPPTVELSGSLTSGDGNSTVSCTFKGLTLTNNPGPTCQ